MSDSFGELFAQYQVKMGISKSNDLCAEISKMMEYLPIEKQEELLKGFIGDDSHTLRKLMVTLARNNLNITELAKQIEIFNDLSATVQVQTSRPEPTANLPKKATTKAPEEGGPLALASTASKIFVPNMPPQPAPKFQPNAEGDGKSGDDGEEAGTNQDSAPTPPQSPRAIRNPSAPVHMQPQQKEEEYSFLDWFKSPRDTWAKSQKNKAIRAAKKTSQPGATKLPGSPSKKPVKKWVWWVVGIFSLALLIFGYYTATGNRVSDIMNGIGDGKPSVPVVPDEGLTAMTPEEKENWANSRLSSSVTETFLTKPTSFVDFFTNWNSYLNWLLYIAAVLLVSYSIFRERTQSAEFSDIRQYIIGISSALIFITFSNLIGNWAFNAGWTTSPFVFQYVALVVGFLINIFMQYSAYDSGNKDASVLAAGVYIFGLLLKWWFPLDALLSTVGFGLMLVGLVIQYLEIGRHADRDSGAITKSLVASILMLVVFSAVYIWMYSLLESQIASFVIPADVTAQAGAALKLNLLVKGQIATSALVALLLAYVFGLVYGSIFLATKGRDGTVDIRNALVLDADASTLFVMFLFLFLPWIWVLPRFWLMMFG